MLGLVIVTHSRLADELLSAAQMIIGPNERVRAVSIAASDSVEEIRLAVAKAIDEVSGDDDGVLIMTDMFGGTPSNISLSFLVPDKVEVVTGVNLPMVLKFFNSHEDIGPGQLASMLKAYGQQSIALASDFLPKQS